MTYGRGWIALFLFALALINYIDRVTLSFAAAPIAKEYGLSNVTDRQRLCDRRDQQL
jgi:hypothetical protein